MTTTAKKQRLADRRTVYSDRKISNQSTRRAEETARQTGCTIGDAKPQAIREMAEKLK